MVRSRLTRAVFATAGLGLTAGAHASSVEWVGSSSNTFEVGANWQGGVVPTASQDALFNLASYTYQPTVSATDPVYGLIFGSSTAAVTLSNASGGSLAVGGDGVQVASGAGAVAISAPISFTNIASIINNSSTGLTFTGALTAGATTVSLNGSGKTTFSGGGTLNTSGGLYVGGTGTVHISLASSSITGGGITIASGATLSLDASNFGGNLLPSSQAITVNSGGTLIINASHALGSGGAAYNDDPIVLNGGTLISNDEQYESTLNLTGGTVAKGTGGDGAYELRSPYYTNTIYTTNAASTISTIGDNLNGVGGNFNFIVASGTVTGGVDLNVTGTIYNGQGIAKGGAGVMQLSASNTYTGATIVNAGTLTLGASGSINASSGLVFGGGTFAIGSTNPVSQAFASTNISSGSSTLANSGTNPLALNAISRTVGSTIDFGSGNVTTTTANTSTILGGWATFGGGATWATSAGTGSAAGAVTGYAGYTTLTAGDTNAPDYTGDLDVTSSLSPSAAITVNSLRFNSAQTLTLASGSNVVSSGGILVTPSAGTGANITGGTLEGAAGADLIVNQYNPGGFTISSVIADNTSATALTIAGTGTTTLTGSNTYTGKTVISGGTLSISADANLGTAPASATAASLVINNGTLLATGSFALNSSRGIAVGPLVGPGTGTINISSGSTVTYGGVIANQGGIGSLIKTGAGTLLLTATPTYSGTTTVNGGSLNLNTGNSSISGIGYGSGLIINNGGTVATGTDNALQGYSDTYKVPVTINAGGTLTTTSAGPDGGLATTSHIGGLLTLNGGTLASGGSIANYQYGTWDLDGGMLVTASSSMTAGDVALTQTGGTHIRIVAGATLTATASAGDNFYDGSTGMILNGPGYSGTLTLNSTGSQLGSAGLTTNGGTLNLNGGGNTGTFVGNLTINSGATVNTTVGDALGYNGTGNDINLVTINGGLLNDAVNANEGYLTNFNLNGGTMNSSGGGSYNLNTGYGINSLASSTTSTINGGVTVRGTSLVFNVASGTTANGVDLQMNGGFGGSGYLSKIGTGNLVWNSEVGYGGAINISGGTFTIAHYYAFYGSPGYNVFAGATLAMTTSSALFTPNALNISDGIVTNNASATDNGLPQPTTMVGGTLTGTSTGDGNGVYTLSNALAFVATSDSSGVPALVNVPIGLSASTSTFQVSQGALAPASDMLVTAPIKNAGNSAVLIKTGNGVLTLAAANTYTGGTTISAGTLQLGDGTTAAHDGSLNAGGGITNNAALVFNIVGSQTYSGAISGTGTVAKLGAGTQVLSGSNSYSGNTTVTAGKLYFNGTSTGTGPISVASGATLGGTGSTSATATIANGGIVEAGQTGAGSLTLGGLLLGSTGTLNIGTVANYGSTPAINVTGNYDPGTSTGGITINVASLTGASANTTYELIGYTGSNADNQLLSQYTLSPLPSRTGGTLTDVYNSATGTGQIDLTIGSIGSAYIIWTGQTNSSWDTSTVNWNLSTGGTTTFQTNDNVVFNDTATTGIVNIGAANVSASSVSFNNNSLNYTISGAYGITGAAGLTFNGSANVAISTPNSFTGGITMNGTGTVALSGSNTFSGPVAVNAGILSLQSSNALGSSSGVTVASGATMQLSGGITVGAIPLTLNGTGAFGQTAALVNSAGSNTYGGPLTLAGNSIISVDAGSLTLSSTGSFNISSNTLTLAGAGGTTGTVASPITGTGGIVKTGGGTWTLSGGNSFTGLTNVSAGTLVVSGSIPGGDSYVVAQNASLYLGYSSGGGYTGGITLNGSGLASAAGVYLKGGVNFQTNSGFLIQTAPTTVTTYGTGTATLQGFDVHSGVGNDGAFLYVTSDASGTVISSTVNFSTGSYGYGIGVDAGANTSTGDLTIAGSITGGGAAGVPSNGGFTAGLNKIGSGSLLLTGVSTYSSNTSIGAGSIILAGGNNLLPVGTAVQLGANGNSGVLQLNGMNQSISGLVVGGSGNASAVVAGTATPSTLTINYNVSGMTDSFPGTLGGSNTYQNNLALVTTGQGTVDLDNTNTYANGTTVTQGTLIGSATGSFGTGNLLVNPTGTTGTSTDTATVVSNNSFAPSAIVTVNSSSGTAIGNVTFNGGSEVIAALTGNGTVTLNGSLTTGNTSSTTFSGNISGPGMLTVAGTGTFALTGSNTYTGGTNISSGVLKFSSPTAFPQYTSLTISNGATGVVSTFNAGSPKNTLFTNGLTIAGSLGAWQGKLQLNNNDLVVRNGDITTVTNQVAQGYNGGAWNGSEGITSHAAAIDTTHLTALGVIANDDGTGTDNALYTSFDGQSVYDGDILVKYTYYGDANLDGHVDGTDYSRIDNGYLNNLTGWFNGDFNYDGVINGSDYTLIDNAYNTQGAQISAEVASATAQIVSGTSAVPEPATLSLLGFGAIGLLGRRRRRA
jgi:autotransporter-associated beta strand protein